MSGKAAPKTQSLKAGDHLYLIDGSGYIFRALSAIDRQFHKNDKGDLAPDAQNLAMQ